MTTLHAFQTAIAEDLKTHLPSLEECEPHPGRFNEDELKRMSARAPGIYVAVLGWGKAEEVGTEELDLPLIMAAYIVTNERRGMIRDKAALNLAESLTLHIAGQQWGQAYAHPAMEAAAQNLYSGKIDRMGVALWAVTWRQTVRLGTDCWADDGTLPTELYLGLSPDVGLGHEDDYELVAETDE